jgi:tripartite-type tricarboxylate transporter receptor subunit TctC
MYGEINMMFVYLAPGMPLVQAGKIKSLDVLTQQRLGSSPELPSVAENANGFYLVGWLDLLAPGGTPDAIIAKINATRRLFKTQQSV